MTDLSLLPGAGKRLSVGFAGIERRRQLMRAIQTAQTAHTFCIAVQKSLIPRHSAPRQTRVTANQAVVALGGSAGLY